MRVHLCLVEPAGYQHSAALADPLLFFQQELRRAGADVSAGVNQLEGSAVNLVFGAHLGFNPELISKVSCVFVNLEQTGLGGAQLSPQYLNLLRLNPTIDYHSDNILSYQQPGRLSELVRFGYAEHLAGHGATLEERPIDVLFVGSVTPRRREVLRQLEAAGVEVTTFSTPSYGADRDDLVRQTKLVLNISAYESARFEQVRASVVLSCGTPMVTEDRGWQHQDDVWAQAYVHHFDPAAPERFFLEVFGTRDFFTSSRAQLQAWAATDVSDDYRRVLEALATTPRALELSAS